MKYHLFTTLVTSLLFTTTANATAMQATFNHLETDANARLITVEADTALRDNFTQLDKNDDGLLSRAESASDPALWSRFKHYDRDNNNKLSLSEFSQYASKQVTLN
ncbi:hypothetical protein [Pseudoalteromonas mariniglutinosa]|uniref:hypothetical protein n=1 Tax=Pseudoalteromonas mariniglutinosa TaxID=206042 RepID=UPI00384AA453